MGGEALFSMYVCCVVLSKQMLISKLNDTSHDIVLYGWAFDFMKRSVLYYKYTNRGIVETALLCLHLQVSKCA